MSDKRFIKVKATLKHSNATIIQVLEVEPHQRDCAVFDEWLSGLLINCGFEHVSADRGSSKEISE